MSWQSEMKFQAPDCLQDLECRAAQQGVAQGPKRGCLVCGMCRGRALKGLEDILK